MKVFLDDVREPAHCMLYMGSRIGIGATIYNSEWVTVRNYDQFKDFFMSLKDKSVVTHVSFDHDLADEHYDPAMSVMDNYEALRESFKEKTGLDCAKWLKWLYNEYNLPLPHILVHSMNPVGTQAIINVFK